MACCCSSSHWWHAPIYFSISLLLAAIAITTPPPSSSSSLSPLQPISLNATTALKSHGFTIIATLLHLSPDIFLSNNSSSTTIFAIHDDAVSNLTAPPSAIKLLLQYHSLPSKFSLQQLLVIPQNTCLPSSIPSKNLSLTKKNQEIQINNVPISHPDLFLDDSLSIHGVLAPFSTLNPHQLQSGRLDFIQSPPCDFSDSNSRPEYADNWVRIIRVLSSNGFVSFAIGLNSVLNGIIAEYPDLGPITIFAPPEFNFVSSSGPFLDRVVRYHIVGHRYSYSEITSLPEKAQMMTLLRGEALEINTSSVNGSKVMGINGVYVVSPDVFSTERLIVHGISRAFEFVNHANS